VPEEDVLGDGQLLGEVELLVDGGDAERLGVLGAADGDGPALEEDLTLVPRVGARE